MPFIARDYIAILRLLAAANVRFILIGGVAMAVRGSDHLTTDIDIFYDRSSENIARLIRAFDDHKPRPRNFPPDLPFVFDAQMVRNAPLLTLETDLGPVDLLAEVSGVESFEDVWNRSTEEIVEDVAVRVVSLDDLIAMKKAASRLKDIGHIMELEAIRDRAT